MANMFDWNALDQKINPTIAEYYELGRSNALTVVAVFEIMEIDIDEAVDAITDGGNDVLHSSPTLNRRKLDFSDCLTMTGW